MKIFAILTTNNEADILADCLLSCIKWADNVFVFDTGSTDATPEVLSRLSSEYPQIVQVGAVPVFIDADPITGNARCDQLEEAYQEGKTKAVMMAHSLGNPFDLATTLAFCRKYNLWLVEDNCDALGCSYSMPRDLAESLGFSENSPGLDEGSHRVVRWTGTWGDISTQSF